MQATDRLNLTNVMNPGLGSDGTTDVLVSNPGADLALKRPCHLLEIHWFQPGDGRLVLRVHHADGSVTDEVQDLPRNRPTMAALSSASGILQVEMLTDALKSFLLYRVCCRKPGEGSPNDRRACIAFDDLPRRIDGQAEAVHEGITIRPLAKADAIRLADLVDTTAPRRTGQTGGPNWSFRIGGSSCCFPRAAATSNCMSCCSPARSRP